LSSAREKANLTECFAALRSKVRVALDTKEGDPKLSPKKGGLGQIHGQGNYSGVVRGYEK